MTKPELLTELKKLQELCDTCVLQDLAPDVNDYTAAKASDLCSKIRKQVEAELS